MVRLDCIGLDVLGRDGLGSVDLINWIDSLSLTSLKRFLTGFVDQSCLVEDLQAKTDRLPTVGPQSGPRPKNPAL